MIKKLFAVIQIFLLVAAVAGCAGSPEELSVLSSLAKDSGKQDRLVKGETERYQNVLEAVHEGLIKKGMTKEEVIEEYGAPVIVLPRPRGEALVYKHGDATWFDSRKVYLFFDTSTRYVNALAPGKDVPAKKS